MAIQTKTQDAGKVVPMNSAALENVRIVSAITDDIRSRGYAIADEYGLRVYTSTDLETRAISPKGAVFKILKEKSAISGTIASIGVPGVRLLRRGADAVATLRTVEDNDFSNWKMTINGERDTEGVEKLAQMLAARHSIKIKTEMSPFEEKEVYMGHSLGYDFD